jgi:hypothetical protein
MTSAVSLHVEIVADLQIFSRLHPLLAPQIVTAISRARGETDWLGFPCTSVGGTGSKYLQQRWACVGFDKEHFKNPDEQVIKVGRNRARFPSEQPAIKLVRQLGANSEQAKGRRRHLLSIYGPSRL